MAKKKKEATEIDSKEKAPPRGKSMRADTDSGAGVHLQNTEEESIPLTYQKDPNYKDLLLHFQYAEWEKCLDNIDHLLGVYPEDRFLTTFKQDVEVRLAQQKLALEQQTREKRGHRRRWVSRAMIIIPAGILLVLFLVWAADALQVAQTQSRLEIQATLTAQSLADKNLTADKLLRAGKPAEALDLYNEIKQMDPAYPDINQKIQLASEAVTIEELYQAGTQALQDGQKEDALELLLKVEGLHPKYKDTPQLIQQIQQEQLISSLVDEIHNAYLQEDWDGVIQAYETIQSIAPLIEIPEVETELFISYQNFIVATADRADATLADIEKAEKYYRKALALFPENREYANERSELRELIPNLLSHKYYLFGVSLLESSDYSIKDLPEAIRILTMADSVGNSSPIITDASEKAQLFLDSYNSFFKRDWDRAIEGFGKIYRKDENYAGGRLKYLLYEAYIARGNIFFAYADFTSAAADYQDAESIAWSDEGNIIRLFEIEVRTAATLYKLDGVSEAAEYYHYAFERLGIINRLTSSEKGELLNLLTQANLAYKDGRTWDAIRLYQGVLEQKKDLYDYTMVSVRQGDTLFDVSFQYRCTFESLINANQLGETMIFVKDQDILVPILPAEGQ